MEIVLGDIKIDIPPERKIDFTGLRVMVKYDVPGDRPKYQDMGRDERTVRWNGIFYGDGAYDQARALQDYYDGGKNVDDGTEQGGFKFLFENIVCRVLIKSYSFQYYRKDMVRYDIELVRLESDYDKKDAQQKTKTDKVAAAKNSLDKLKDDINKAMKTVNEVSKTAQSIQQSIYNARKQYLTVVNSITRPITNMKQQVESVKTAFDRALATVNHSVGRVSTPAARTELSEALQTTQNAIPLAKSVVALAQLRSLGQRFDEFASGLPTYTVQQGDTLRSIATAKIGSPHQWVVLAQVNRLTSSILPAGLREIKVVDSTNVAQAQSLISEQVSQLPAMSSDYLPVNLR